MRYPSEEVTNLLAGGPREGGVMEWVPVNGADEEEGGKYYHTTLTLCEHYLVIQQ